MAEKYTTQTKCTSADLVTEPGGCCVDTHRIYDSCIGQECLRALRVYVTDAAQAILNETNAIRVREIRVLWTQILTEEVPFKTGYYEVTVRYYFIVTLEACLGLGNAQIIRGLACYEKSVILYGGEGRVTVFTSDEHQQFCGSLPQFGQIHSHTNAPRVVVEVATPVGLEATLVDGVLDPTEACPIPDELEAEFEGSFEGETEVLKSVYATIGIFTIIRLERPAQLLMSACENCFPDKTCESGATFSDACSLFNSMSFPYEEFAPIPQGATVDLSTDKSTSDPTVDPKNYS